ncbi:MAG TPA: hypothetical protein VLA95_05355 [Gemmatimonadales bacterium]|nr:hypothetical protein [Gemmatimonadales bacterium]
MRDRAFLPGLLLATALAGCDGDGSPTDPAPPTGPPSAAFGIWTPGPGECAKAVHDAYAVVGPDGKLYPTWHPPEDPSGCSFGHEHGRDPAGSDLAHLAGGVPFGVANEALEAYDPANPRREDHVGHKIEWENDVELRVNGGTAGATVRCDVLTKLHQGTHSKDAFTNNLHEQVYHVRCEDGTGVSVTLLAAIGNPGEFRRSCDLVRVDVGPATPVNSPYGDGERLLPDRTCLDQYLFTDGPASDYNAALRESWQTTSFIRAMDGRAIASFNPYYQVLEPSRYHDPASPTLLRRALDACTETLSDGRTVHGGACEQVTGFGWDDPRSPFRGARRVVDLNTLAVQNADGPEDWYTDPFGGQARTSSFHGGVRQWVSRTASSVGTYADGPIIGGDRAYAGAGTHAPN